MDEIENEARRIAPGLLVSRGVDSSPDLDTDGLLLKDYYLKHIEAEGPIGWTLKIARNMAQMRLVAMKSQMSSRSVSNLAILENYNGSPKTDDAAGVCAGAVCDLHNRVAEG